MKKKIYESIKSFAFAAFVVILIRIFIIEPYKIPTGSMIPNLKVGDHLFVTKFSYDISLPYPFHKTKIISVRKPTRGDIIAFLYPENESLNFVKRVIGIPGDTVELRNKIVYLNGKPLKRELITDPKEYENLKDIGSEYDKESIKLYREYVDDKSYIVMDDTSVKENPLNENFVYSEDGSLKPTVIKEGHFFVMGDNRAHSKDSREWGLVPKNNIKGAPLLIWLSLDLEQPFYSYKIIRYSRFGRMIK